MPIQLPSRPAPLPRRGEPASQARSTRRTGLPAASVALTGVWRSYADGPRREVAALAGVDMRARRGQILAVVGPSGCGKTTLLELVCRLQRPDRGTVSAEPAVLMAQRDLLLPWYSALDNAALALRVTGCSRAQARARAQPLFADLGLTEFATARPQELSGGMRQRVAFLRTLLAGKPVLCLDEPFGALDAITRQEMQRWLVNALAHEPRTVVLVTHDVEEAVLLADRVIVLSARPAHVLGELEVDLPRPRSRIDPAVVSLRERALSALGLADSPGCS